MATIKVIKNSLLHNGEIYGEEDEISGVNSDDFTDLIERELVVVLEEDKFSLFDMTNNELNAYGLENFGLNLTKCKNKAERIELIEQAEKGVTPVIENQTPEETLINNGELSNDGEHREEMPNTSI